MFIQEYFHYLSVKRVYQLIRVNKDSVKKSIMDFPEKNCTPPVKNIDFFEVDPPEFPVKFNVIPLEFSIFLSWPPLEIHVFSSTFGVPPWNSNDFYSTHGMGIFHWYLQQGGYNFFLEKPNYREFSYKVYCS